MEARCFVSGMTAASQRLKGLYICNPNGMDAAYWDPYVYGGQISLT